jgi:hypothetical protein
VWSGSRDERLPRQGVQAARAVSPPWRDALREAERAARDGSLAGARAAAQKLADEFARVQAYLVKTAAVYGPSGTSETRRHLEDLFYLKPIPTEAGA